MQEQRTKEVIIDDITYDAFRAMLEFIYTGQCSLPQDPRLLTDLYIAADKYQIQSLIDLTRNELYIALQSGPSLADQCNVFGKLIGVPDCDACKVVCYREMLRAWDEVVEMEEWQEVSCIPRCTEEVMRLTRLCKMFRLNDDEAEDMDESGGSDGDAIEE
ncbi:hypothetical protein HDV00_001965 [Rhizophlyctis rosea]|nr:hypothetical protein HDV00_001965 [Rhizophlyctis rosea]